MEAFTLRQNIAHFRKLLETETEEAVRRPVLRMLAEAEAELRRLESAAAGRMIDPTGSGARDRKEKS